MRTDRAPPLSVSLLQVWPARAVTSPVEPKRKSAESGYEDARKRRDDAAAEQRARERPLIVGHLRIELDEEAGRFVQTLTDPATNEILRRFPHESQLAFSSAIRAYEMARFKQD